MPKFYIFSDCHGFYDELKAALDEAGFDPNNQEHWLIGAGDYTDRGRQPKQVIDYLNSIERKILVQGNHESLIIQCLKRKDFYQHDLSNGTAQTIMDLAPLAWDFEGACETAHPTVKKFIDGMVDYVELKHHIIVHSFIPLINKDGLPAHYTENRKFAKMKNWRNASTQKWDEARWGNPYELSAQGFLPEKTLIFGHWNTSWARAYFDGDVVYGPNANHDIYYGDGFIGIDAMTAYSHKVNVLVLEDEFMEEM
jgi:serine/threonine protein phosphatase 1